MDDVIGIAIAVALLIAVLALFICGFRLLDRLWGRLTGLKWKWEREHWEKPPWER